MKYDHGLGYSDFPTIGSTKFECPRIMHEELEYHESNRPLLQPTPVWRVLPTTDHTSGALLWFDRLLMNTGEGVYLTLHLKNTRRPNAHLRQSLLDLRCSHRPDVCQLLLHTTPVRPHTKRREHTISARIRQSLQAMLISPTVSDASSTQRC